jgi:hypothetical protein
VVHQNNVDHGSFVHNQDGALKWIVLVFLEPSFLDAVFHHAMNRLCFVTRGFAHLFGRSSGGGGKEHRNFQF